MGKDTVATRRGGAKGRKPVRQKVRYTTSEPFPWLTPRENKKTKKAKSEGVKSSSKLTCGDLDELLELLRSPATPASPPSPPSPMSYEDWVVEENDKAGRVLSQLAQLLGMTVHQMKDIEYEMYNDEESLTACGNICLVYAGGLMMRWVRMVPLEAMRIWTDGGPASVYDNSALSAELLARRWQKLRSLGPVYVAAIFTISMCVATKQINTPLYHFQLEYCMPALRRIGCIFQMGVVNAMEKRFLRHLQWRTHLRMRSNSTEFPDLGLCEYNHILEALPRLVENGEVAWDRLCGLMAVI